MGDSFDSTNVRVKLAGTVYDPAVANATAARAPAGPDVNRRGFRGRNTGMNADAIGSAEVAYASAAIVLLPGENWSETDAPAADWFCVCDTGLTTTLNTQTLPA